MKNSNIFIPEQVDSFIIVILGASGDLTKRKLIPALYNLFIKGKLKEDFLIVGVGRKPYTTSEMIFESDYSEKFSEKIKYIQADYSVEGLKNLDAGIEKLIADKDIKKNYLVYFSTPPEAYVPVTENLHKSGFIKEIDSDNWSRIIYEKPFGRDYESAKKLNADLKQFLDEKQIYRIDHYLGKAAVQNLLIFRFANPIFEPVWNKDFIDNIQINASETLGVMNRGSYYDNYGALRDMIQNHILQIVSILGMETPKTLSADDIRGRKLDFIKTFICGLSFDTENDLIRGQYEGYLNEKSIKENSHTETFAALRIVPCSGRFKNVPIYIKTGKMLDRTGTEVAVTLKPISNGLFENVFQNELPLNTIIFKIQPAEGIIVELVSKNPDGNISSLLNTKMNFCFRDNFSNALPVAYETLLFEAIVGNTTLFVDSEETEEAWKFLQPILDHIETNKDENLYSYKGGTVGPDEMNRIVEKDNKKWVDFAKYENVCK